MAKINTTSLHEVKWQFGKEGYTHEVYFVPLQFDENKIISANVSYYIDSNLQSKAIVVIPDNFEEDLRKVTTGILQLLVEIGK